MKSSHKLLGAAALLVTATAAQSQLYTELTYTASKTKYSGAGITTESAPQTLGVLLGYAVNENLAVEGLIGTGIGGSDVKLNGATQSIPVTAKTDYLYGVFLKPSLKLNDSFEAFFRIGYNEAKTTSSNSTGSATNTYGDLAYGIGANYHFNKPTYKSTYVTVSWMDLYRKDSVKSDGLSFGVGYKF
jgi:hypothetical protein